jgi:hypothetical protein
MELADAVQIVAALADDLDPLTGQPLAADHLCQHPQVVRALCMVVHRLEGYEPRSYPAGKKLANAGKPWTAEEEAELVQAFEAGAKINQLAHKHGRTRQAIQGRLYLLGKVPRWQLGLQPDGGADGIR